ncbi:ISXO2-like transposase domain protein [Leptospira fainei serovar Hurstbridge str. BUT 6]|uniref:ISXO2-like transposase domain protein n=1 Tax=Leptospira fainei serovar Hurstbridge str. BUT 6 TaxID=1193011 RepID=S3W3E1_9LEPT|nr:transposase [Leptospira fainei]EPG74812.1 ISXO2-like transposase domain protein [Leptospira fainei serovar Hurstbridge str. BUT 6]
MNSNAHYRISQNLLERSIFPKYNPYKLRNQDTPKENPIPLKTEYYHHITEFFLDTFYPKFCPECKIQLTKKITTRDYLIRCEECHYMTSRLSYTPLHHFKLPLWVFGYVLEESYLQSPKVLTATAIQKKTGISYKTALLLKRRIQLFASEQKDNVRDLVYSKLQKENEASSASQNTARTHSEKRVIKNRGPKAKKAALEKNRITLTNADTLVLYSASQRANKGRKRHKHGGSTASIYMSDKLGGKQVGTLVHTIATSNGALILDSVPDQKMNTLGPIIRKNIPEKSPIHTDSGYPWLNSVYRNHKMVNHSAHSKDKRYRWARNRWVTKEGVHIQYAEGNHRVIKQAFSSYGYIRPEYSQLYLNEFCFFRNLKVFGLDAIVQNWRERSSSKQTSELSAKVEESKKQKILVKNGKSNCYRALSVFQSHRSNPVGIVNNK